MRSPALPRQVLTSNPPLSSPGNKRFQPPFPLPPPGSHKVSGVRLCFRNSCRHSPGEKLSRITLLIYIQAPLFCPSQTLLSMLENVLWRWVITKSLLQSTPQIKAEETCEDFKSELGILCSSKWIKLCALHLQSVTYITLLHFVSLLSLKFSFLW